MREYVVAGDLLVGIFMLARFGGREGADFAGMLWKEDVGAFVEGGGLQGVDGEDDGGGGGDGERNGG